MVLFSCGRRIRTNDLQVMSLASYLCSIPQFAGTVGFEPTTLWLTVRCSDQLSYVPNSLSNFQCNSLWQLQHNKIHLSTSCFIFSNDLDEPYCPIPKSFSLGLMWWNSRAEIHLSYPQCSHLPPLYSTSYFFTSFRLFLTLSDEHFLHL